MPPQARSRALTTALLVALSGTITGLAAAGHVGPFAALGAAQQHTVASRLPSVPLRADRLYPAPTQPPAVQQVIVVTDPPVSPPQTSASTADATPTPYPTSNPSPTPKPCHDDDCGGGGGGGDN